MPLTEQELLDLKQDINDSKENISKLEGKQELMEEELETKWKCKTTEEAEKSLKKMKGEIETFNTSIEEKTEQLETKLQEHENEQTED